MPPKSPLPPRHGLQAAWVRTPDRNADDPLPWPTMRDWLVHKLAPSPEDVDDMLGRGVFVDDRGRPWTGREEYRPHTFVWFHRELRDEAPVPGKLTLLHLDERIAVFDKPHFLSTIPRGRHILESAVVKARRALDLPELSAAHRLDRGTAGVLLMTTEKRWRAAYHSVFTARTAVKTYRAIAPFDPALVFPLRVESHLVKRVGTLQAETLDHPPNAVTDIDLLEVRGDHALYEVRPLTGRTHQIRAHFNGLGIPLLGDPLYPEILSTDIDDFSTPMRLLAHRLEFPDPVDGSAQLRQPPEPGLARRGGLGCRMALTRTQASAALPDWRYLLGRMHLTVDAGTFPAALGFVNEVARIAEEHNHHPEIDLRYSRVHLAVASHDAGGITDRDVAFGAAVAEAMAARGLRPSVSGLAEVEVAVDALDIPAVLAFWRAVTGYVDDGPEALIDPQRIGPRIWFQQMDEPRPHRNRIHIDLTVAHDEAGNRMDAALAAGGTLLNDAAAPSFWVLADPEGNEVCVCTWQGRDEWDALHD